MEKKTTKQHVQSLVLAAMFLALGLVLPFVTGQIPKVGNMLLPMHIPVMLCGLICGWQYGGIVGFVTPLLRFALFGAPPMPGAVGMAFELAAYAIIVGLVYGRSRWKCVVALYRALIIAMIGGRVVWAVARMVMMGAVGFPFSWEVFVSAGFVTAIPGIVLQLIVIPAVMVALDRTGLVRFTRKAPAPERG